MIKIKIKSLCFDEMKLNLFTAMLENLENAVEFFPQFYGNCHKLGQGQATLY
jgi:hypothetical protein